MRGLMFDVHWAARQMWRKPWFSLAVAGVLAVGVGANTAIFSLVNTVLLRPLPFEEPDQLVRLYTRTPGGRPFDLSAGKFYGWQQDAQAFDGMAMYRFRQFALTASGRARAIEAGAVSTGFFQILRVRPALGRVFRPDEDTPGKHRVAIVSDRFWRNELGGTPDAIGRALTLDDASYVIVGVLPPNASVSAWDAMATEIWVPMALTDAERVPRGNHNQQGIARVKPASALPRAQAELNTLSARYAQEFPATDKGWGAMLVALQDDIVGDSRTTLSMLLGAVGLVLLIACANVGNLLFTRGLTRRKEMAIRSALGAGRGRVFQQLLVEAWLLSAAGGAFGLVLAHAALMSASTVLAAQVPRADEVSVDGRVLTFVLLVSVVTGLLTGTWPAVRAGRADLNDALKEGGRSEGVIGIGTRRVLIVCEVALSLVLLMGAGVMVQSLLALKHGDSGFDANQVLTVDLSLVGARYPTPAHRFAFFDATLKHLRSLPGVEAAGTIDTLPLTDGSSQTLTLEGYPPQPSPPAVQVRQITPGYVRAMRIPILHGRDVVAEDANVLLVSREAARLYWGEDNPIGRRASLPALSKTVLRQVVGIVGDVKQRNLVEGATPTVYFYTHEPYARATFVIRTSVPPATVALPAVAAIRTVDSAQPVGEVRTMMQRLEGTLASQRVSAMLLTGFAAVGLLLAAMGIYSVLSYIVRGRSREIGIRTALGAGTTDVLGLVVREGMAPTLVGVAAGIVAALAAARVLETLVFGVSPSDPLTLAAVAVALVLVALMAGLVPAYRALRLDPVKVLRGD
jgi:predicted permease